MAQIYLLSPTRLKQDSLLCENVDDKYCINAIRTAQDIQLVELIGECLYKKVCGLVGDKTINKPENVIYKELLDSYIIPFLTLQSTAEIILPLQFKLRNAGLTQSADQQTQYATIEDAQYTSQHYQNKARFYGRRMTDWIAEMADQIPEAIGCSNGSCGTGVKAGKYRVNITL